MYTTRLIPAATMCLAQIWQGKVVQYRVESRTDTPFLAASLIADISAWMSRPNSMTSIILLSLTDSDVSSSRSFAQIKSGFERANRDFDKWPAFLRRSI